MKIVINRDDLIKYLTIADSIINVKTPLAILLNIYLEAFDDGNIILLSYNGENGVRVEGNAVVEEPGKVALLSKKFLEIIRKIPSNNVMIESNPNQENEIFIHPAENDNPNFIMYSVPADTFPIFNEFNWENYIKVSQETFLEQINSTEFAVSDDISKISFTGIYIEESVEGYLTLVSSDGKRLSYITRPYEEKKGQVELSVIIPGKIFNTIKPILKTGDVLFSVKNQAYFKINNVYIFSNLVEGKFPHYKDVIPKDRKNIAIIDSTSFLNALDIVSVMSDPDTKKIFADIETDKIALYTSNNVLGVAKEYIPIEYNGTPLKIAFNYKAIMDFLRVVNNQKIICVINSVTSPMLLKPINDDNFIYVCMPMRIQEE